jgi:hypothetical protein
MRMEAPICRRPLRHSDVKETNVLRKTCVTGGLIIAVSAGTLVSGSAAIAQPMGGWGHFRHHFRSFSGNSNWGGNENLARNRIRIRIHNRNNNVAVARNEQRERQRQFQRDEEEQQQQRRPVRPVRPRAVTAALCTAGGGTPTPPPQPRFCRGGIFDGLPVID